MGFKDGLDLSLFTNLAKTRWGGRPSALDKVTTSVGGMIRDRSLKVKVSDLSCMHMNHKA